MKTLQLDFIKCIIPKSRTFKHFLAFLPDAYLATKILDMSGKNLTYGNPNKNCMLSENGSKFVKKRVIFANIKWYN